MTTSARPIGLPLYARILGWFLVNLVLVAVVLALVIRSQFSTESFMSGTAGLRLQQVADTLDREIYNADPEARESILAKYGRNYGLRFMVFSNTGRQIAGAETQLPEKVQAKFGAAGDRPGGRGPGGERRDGPPRGDEPSPPDDRNGPPPRNDREPGDRPPGPDERGPRFDDRLPGTDQRGMPGSRPGPPANAPRFFVHTENPSRYWLLAPMRPWRGLPRGDNPPKLVIESTTFTAGGLLFDFGPWLKAGALLLALSALWWIPFVRGITRSISGMMKATERIAGGDFEATLNVRRKDELGALAFSINSMTSQLDALARGQKRFLGDVAHELCSPIARMQTALAILEQHAPAERDAHYLGTLREELDSMSALVDELLQFSRAGVQRQIELSAIHLRSLAGEVAAHEAPNTPVELQIPGDLTVQAEVKLLSRALGNVLRNAVRYAGEENPIRIAANPRDGEIVLTITDQGPGVPLDTLPRLFDAFYRPDAARARETGGAGLGLAIVRTCLDACGGSVTARNVQPNGLQVIFILQSAAPLALPEAAVA